MTRSDICTWIRRLADAWEASDDPRDAATLELVATRELARYRQEHPIVPRAGT